MLLLIVGDAPNRQTGLGRIARDLTRGFYADAYVGVGPFSGVVQLGLGYDGSPWGWRVFPLHDVVGWGEQDIRNIYRRWLEVEPEQVVVLTAWDPIRCWGVSRLRQEGLIRAWWGYFTIDSHNPSGRLGGPADEIVRLCDRPLAYGRFGQGVLENTLRGSDGPARPVEWLPHGLDEATWRPLDLWSWGAENTPEERLYDDPGTWTVGCVAANQPRKDYSLVFAAAAHLREMVQAAHRARLRLWVHTDEVVGQQAHSWSIPELAEQYGFNNAQSLFVTTGLSDIQLARFYSVCDVTIAPGLGEGFGYPIAESLACGTPVVHGAFGGGSMIVPPRWVVDYGRLRWEGHYLHARPLYDARLFAEAAYEAASWKRTEPRVCCNYCTGAVAHLGWSALWLRWRSWARA